VTFSMLADRLWEAQLFFAFAGLPWIALVVLLNARFVRGGAILTARGRASMP
jgi:hypothetical protein